MLPQDSKDSGSCWTTRRNADTAQREGESISAQKLAILDQLSSELGTHKTRFQASPSLLEGP